MKLHMKAICSTIGLLALSTSVFAGHTKAVIVEASPPGKVYVGIFGGGGSSRDFKADQYGTAFFPEIIGGPLAVNAFGSVNHRAAGFVGGQLGYKGQNILLNPVSQWSMAPGAELEAYFLGSRTFSGNLGNNTARLPEHTFDVSYPMTRNIFLVNAVLNFGQPCFMFHPYLGLGIGSALLRISSADSLQVAPPEAGVNHYNANTSDSDTTFAGQIKLGLSYDINPTVSVFAEYRWLYIGSTHFTFGSTVYPTHAATSSWEVNLDPQRLNQGSIGIRFNLA